MTPVVWAIDSPAILQWAIAAGLGAILLEVVRSLFQRKKMDASAAKSITDSTLMLLDPLKAEIKRLQGEVTTTRRELTMTKAELSAARREVRQLRDRVKATNEGLDA